MRVGELFDEYRDRIIIQGGQSDRTLETHEFVRKYTIEYLGDLDIKSLNFENTSRICASWRKNRSQNTVRLYIIRLRSVLRYARLRDLPVVNYELLKIPKRKAKVVDFLESEEVTRLIDCVFAPRAGYSRFKRLRNRAIISLLYSSGIRLSELISIDCIDIKKDHTFTVIGKGDKPRLCFIDERTWYYIEEWIEFRTDESPALFISELTGKRISKSTVQEICRNAQARSGFGTHIHPHILRHSFATNLLRNNTNLLLVRDFLGHSSVQTTQMYTHVVNEDLRKAYLKNHTT